jgi:threonine synthase
MGLPVASLIVATNVNDILARTIQTGRYVPRDVTATVSPSMDIQISSNFERLLFEIAGRDPRRVVEHMSALATTNSFSLNQGEHASLRQDFQAACVDEEETLATIRDMQKSCGYLADPHTAVGIAAAAKVTREPSVPMITLATAHPAKFPDAVARATGIVPPEPATLAEQRRREERVSRLPNSLAAVAEFVTDRTRARRPS